MPGIRCNYLAWTLNVFRVVVTLHHVPGASLPPHWPEYVAIAHGCPQDVSASDQEQPWPGQRPRPSTYAYATAYCKALKLSRSPTRRGARAPRVGFYKKTSHLFDSGIRARVCYPCLSTIRPKLHIVSSENPLWHTRSAMETASRTRPHGGGVMLTTLSIHIV